MAIRSIHLENLTVFENIQIDFSTGINVFIGENGTGKTHLLKTLYAWCGSEICAPNDHGYIGKADFMANIASCFQNKNPNEILRRILRDSEDNKQITVSIKTEEGEYSFYINTTASFSVLNDNGNVKRALPCIFIPAKDMLTHSGLEKDFSKRNLPIDATLIDILNNAGVSTLKELEPEMANVLNRIACVIGGRVIYENSKYFIDRKDVGPVEFALEAEGFKKFGLIYRLIETGEITKGSILLWDEPEANLNPKLMPVLVDIILELEKASVQMFFATHDYFFAKFLEARKNKDTKVLYHAFYKEKDAVLCESGTEFEMLENNSIIAQSIALYKEEVSKVMG